MTLVLRRIGPDDYSVLDDGEPVGRIRLEAEQLPASWAWNVTLPAPGGGIGSGRSLDEAKAQFRQSWATFKAALGPERYAAAIDTGRNARER